MARWLVFVFFIGFVGRLIIVLPWGGLCCLFVCFAWIVGLFGVCYFAYLSLLFWLRFVGFWVIAFDLVGWFACCLCFSDFV